LQDRHTIYPAIQLFVVDSSLALAMPSPSFSHELETALRAVHRASIVTKDVLRSLKNNVSAESKADDSPVTLADFAAQALIISAIHAVFPSDSFLGEESAAALRENDELRSRVWDLVQSAPTVELQASDSQLARPDSADAMLAAIDRGATDQTATGRVWVLDPVDGTATFMQGHQYAVCLCLLVDGVQQVGVIGCPNLLLDPESTHAKIIESEVDTKGYGVVVSAVKGEGASVRPLHVNGLGAPRPLEQVQQSKPLIELDFVEPTLTIKTSLSLAEHKNVAELLGAKWPGTQLWSLQLKYVSLALGATDVMVRLPTGRDRYTHIWDHAGGQLIFQEAGGKITDLDGGEIDFSQGRRLLGYRNYGTVAARPWAFDKVMEKVLEVLNRRGSK
jgi:3'(2'), 5'-bisphosphate nucleotidase